MSEKKTLHVLATEHGQIAPPVPEGSPYLVEHRIAAQIHGWQHHEHHYGPVLLTAEEYEGALEAGRKGYTPHKPAVPPQPTNEEIAAKHAKALADSSESDEVKASLAALPAVPGPELDPVPVILPESDSEDEDAEEESN